MATTKIVRIYTGADRRSHFEDLAIPMSDFRLGSLFSLKSEMIPVKGLVIANAVASALASLGVQAYALPLSPPRIWQMIEDARGAPK